jgi:tetratricopeptide (TPR) repeat protein
MFRSIVLLVGGLASLWTVSLSAQDAILGQQFGLGAHAYFSGDYQKATEYLTSAIQGGSEDPRVYYFRGLSDFQLGRKQQAAEDFKRGARLESREANRFFFVSKSLERVQGQARAELESYRNEARMATMKETEKLRKARYEAIQREESRVMRENAIEAEPVVVSAPTPEPAAPDPIAELDTKPAQKVKKPVVKTEKKAATKAAEDKPAAKAAAEKSGAKPAAAAAENPFVTKAAPSTPKPAAEKKPVETKKPADGKGNPDNPF